MQLHKKNVMSRLQILCTQPELICLS